MVRKTGWRWRGDYFDPEIPAVVEPHFRIWDAETERFSLEGLEGFWERRQTLNFRGRGLPVLGSVDRFGYAAVHVLRHLLRGSVKPFHVFELAYFLHHKSADEAFWEQWREQHPMQLRAHQAIAATLAERWFGCRLPLMLQQEQQSLPSDVRAWFEYYAAAPVIKPYRPNKDELWLHLALLKGWSDRAKVVRRRLVPGSFPGPVDAVFVPREQLTTGLRARRALSYGAFLARRTSFHLRSFLTLPASGVRWQRCRRAVLSEASKDSSAEAGK
jgi:hypothetical protein